MNSLATFTDKDARIYVAGHAGLVGSALVRELEARGYRGVITRPHAELDLRRQSDTEEFFQSERLDYVFLAAARVGGILANDTYPAEFIYDNLAIALNVINSAFISGVKGLLNLGSSCIYPRRCPQPMREEHLLTGGLEPSNEAYAVAKIAAVKLCSFYNRQHGTNFLSVMPANLYGPGDNFDPEGSHVVPALIGRFHEAKLSGSESVKVWGTGTPRRELLYVDDLARACVHLVENCTASDIGEFINVGTGEDLTIAELASVVADVVGYTGTIEYDHARPDGTERKLLDVSRANGLGWRHTTGLEAGLEKTYRWYLENVAHER